ncbi:uncharacterized protein (DUF1330 family) [Flavobacterium sp. HSC-32F16]|uniref:DUF1330 domain-containing protein n=1 Tax=Flavobacterium sp. HSC-32F16 TaxID=2910964 RepID=UPI0020A470C4|nr:DUF1330 domain-containing protein [Flavobacterium sp. HSC-32F16]MCP2025818.1 uncharacterized protein (DUF1330 family) [Flavobacterium sp. HSC-32F16]
MVLLIALTFSVLSFGLKNTTVSTKADQQTVPNGYLVMNYNVRDRVIYKKYTKAVNQLWTKYKGELIIYSTVSKSVEGTPGSVVAVVRFPTIADAEKCYNSSQYTALKKLRSASTEGSVLLAESNMPAVISRNQIKPHGYMIANYEIKNQATFQKYMDAAGTLAPKYNGEVTVFDFKAKVLEGKGKPVFGVAEFNSLIEAEKFYNSQEYTLARRFRITSTEGTVLLAQGTK